MLAITMRARTKVTSPSLWSRRLGPSFAFRRNLPNLIPEAGRRGESVTVDPESLPFPEAGWDKDTEAFVHVLDYTTNQEVRRRIAFVVQIYPRRRWAIHTRGSVARGTTSPPDHVGTWGGETK